MNAARIKVQDNILKLVCKSGGTVSISQLKDEYSKCYGIPISSSATSNVKLKKWIERFDPIGTKQVASGTGYVGYFGHHRPHKTSTP